MTERNRRIFNFIADLGEKIPLIGRDSIIPSLKYKGPSEPKDVKPVERIKPIDKQQSNNGNRK